MQQFFSLLSWRLFRAQHVSGIFPPIIRSSMTAVAASGFTFVSWWQSCCVRGRAGRLALPRPTGSWKIVASGWWFIWIKCKTQVPNVKGDVKNKVKVKVNFTLEQATKVQSGGVKVYPYSFFNLGARWGLCSTQRPDRFTPGKTRHPLYRRLGGPKGRSGMVRKISPPPGFDPQTVQPLASRYTDWSIAAPLWKMCQRKLMLIKGTPVSYPSLNCASITAVLSHTFQLLSLQRLCCTCRRDGEGAVR